MAWAYLLPAGLFEVGWAVGLKFSHGTRFSPSVATVLAMVVSPVLLGLALRSLPLGIALFAEAADGGRLACVGLIVAGIVGLKVLALN
jgi:quaternary ammonium compound-resistance protein SugE